MRAVLDTSVFISLLLSPRGSGAWLMALWYEKRYELVISPAIFSEFVDVLGRAEVEGKIDPQRKLALFRRLRQDALWTSGAPLAHGMLVDAADDFLLDAALEANAEFIVTWDSALLNQKSCQGVQIISPDQFTSLVVRLR